MERDTWPGGYQVTRAKSAKPLSTEESRLFPGKATFFVRNFLEVSCSALHHIHVSCKKHTFMPLSFLGRLASLAQQSESQLHRLPAGCPHMTGRPLQGLGLIITPAVQEPRVRKVASVRVAAPRDSPAHHGCRCWWLWAPPCTFQSSCDVEEAVGIQAAEVAGVQPAVSVDGLARPFLHVQVAHEDGAAPHTDLAGALLVLVH